MIHINKQQIRYNNKTKKFNIKHTVKQVSRIVDPWIQLMRNIDTNGHISAILFMKEIGLSKAYL